MLIELKSVNKYQKLYPEIKPFSFSDPDHFFSMINFNFLKIKAPGKGFEPLGAEAQPLPCFDLEAVALPLG